MALSKKRQALIDGVLSLDQAVGKVGLGVDLVEVERMQQVLARTPRFKERVFSEDERVYCDSRVNPAMHYAARFAAKEAVVKALGCGFTGGISLRDIQVVREEGGRPRIQLTGRAQEVADSMGVVDMPISLSHTSKDAIACAMALTADATAKKVSKMSAKEELARQFKDARSMLDELGPASTEAADEDQDLKA